MEKHHSCDVETSRIEKKRFKINLIPAFTNNTSEGSGGEISTPDYEFYSCKILKMKALSHSMTNSMMNFCSQVLKILIFLRLLIVNECCNVQSMKLQNSSDLTNIKISNKFRIRNRQTARLESRFGKRQPDNLMKVERRF